MMARAKMIVAASRKGCCWARKLSLAPMSSMPRAFSRSGNVAISVTNVGSLAGVSAASAVAGMSRKMAVKNRMSDFIMAWIKIRRSHRDAKNSGQGKLG